MKITILCAGKIKEKYLNEALSEYGKRLSGYCSLDIKQVSDEKTPDKASAAEEERIRKVEGNRMLEILSKIKGANSFIVTLVIKGKELDSVELSEMISDCMNRGKSHIIFLIGGSLGLSKEVIEESDFQLSFSKLTFPHQLMRVLLAEQIYRAFRIRANEPYHK